MKCNLAAAAACWACGSWRTDGAVPRALDDGWPHVGGAGSWRARDGDVKGLAIAWPPESGCLWSRFVSLHCRP